MNRLPSIFVIAINGAAVIYACRVLALVDMSPPAALGFAALAGINTALLIDAVIERAKEPK